MGWVKDNFFGGAAKDAAALQTQATEKASGIQQQYYNQARNDLLSLFPSAYQQLGQGYQQAADVISQGRASSANVLQQAFGNANQTIQQGSQAQIDALLGRSSQPMPQPMPQPPQQMQFAQQAPQTSPIQQANTMMQQTGMPMQSGLRQSFGQGNPTMQISGVGQIPNRNIPPAMLNQTQIAGTPVDMRISGGDRAPGLNAGNRTINPITGQQQVTGAQQLPTAVNQTTTQPINPANMGQAQQVQGGDFGGIGLGGAEQALQGGLQGQINALGQGFGAAQGQLADMYGQQTGALQQGAQGAETALNQYGGQALGMMQGGLRQGLGLLDQGYQRAQKSIGQGIGALQQGQQQGLGEIRQGTDRAIGFLDPYSQTGQQALQQEAALSGALGAEAQQAAINNFIESPGQKFLRERQEQSLLRNQAAVGGLRGGATLSALQEQAMGIAATQQQQQLENLRNLAGRGQQAAGQQGGFAQQGGMAGANLIGQMAQGQANLYGQQAGIGANLSGQGAGMAQQVGMQGANLMQGIGQNVAGLRQGLGQNLANAAGQYGQTAAGMSAQQGQLASNAFGNTANQLGGLRFGAGQQVAGQLGQTTNQLAGNQLQLGQLLAGLDQGTAANLSNLLVGGATAGNQNQMQLAQLLANLATGQGTNLANLAIGAGNAQAAGQLGAAQGAQQGVGMIVGGLQSAATAGMMSDKRLKDNITKLYDGAVNLYSWTWKHIDAVPEKLRGALSIGVIAQEVKESHPDCVMCKDGYLAVNYSKLAQEISA